MFRGMISQGETVEHIPRDVLEAAFIKGEWMRVPSPPPLSLSLSLSLSLFCRMCRKYVENGLPHPARDARAEGGQSKVKISNADLH